MTKSLGAKRGRELESGRFRHDDGRTPRFVWMKRRIKDSRRVGRALAGSDRRGRQKKHEQDLEESRAGYRPQGSCAVSRTVCWSSREGARSFAAQRATKSSR